LTNEGDKVSPRTGRLCPAGDMPATHFLLSLSAAGRIKSM